MTNIPKQIEQHAHAACVAPPNNSEWQTRRQMFSRIYRTDIDADYSFPERLRTLERELERCYCAGAFVACVLLSKALAESIDAQFGNKRSEREAFWNKVDAVLPQDGRKLLADLRNDWAHAAKNPDYQLAKYKAYVESQDIIEQQATTAMTLAFTIGCEFSK